MLYVRPCAPSAEQLTNETKDGSAVAPPPCNTVSRDAAASTVTAAVFSPIITPCVVRLVSPVPPCPTVTAFAVVNAVAVELGKVILLESPPCNVIVFGNDIVLPAVTLTEPADKSTFPLPFVDM